MEKIDLSLIPLEDILEEVNRRYDMWIFSGIQLRSRAANEIFTIRKWRGNSATCAGLASQMEIAIYDTACEMADRDKKEGETFEP